VTKAKPKTPPPGKALEVEVRDLFRGSGFRAHLNSRAARPRQTDIHAHGNGMTLLVEVKDRKRVVDVNDIDSLRARLGRTTHDVIGIIFTTSEISRNAIKEIESDRTREVLVFVLYEIELLRASKARLLNLVNKKRSELRTNGRAWFRTSEGGDYLGVALPRSTMEFAAGPHSSPYFCSGTGFAHAAFSMDIPDTSRGNGDGVRLTLTLDLSTLDELKDLFGYLHDAFGLSSNGAFTIHQEGACWHGVGVQNLLNALPDPWTRYRAASMEKVHHSEDISYFDQFRSGWLALTTQQRVPDGSHSAHLHQTDVCIQLPGMPVDASPYLELCRYTGNEWADFRSVQERHTQTRRLKKPLRLEVLGTLVRTDDDREKDRWIVGLIARNPFFRKKKLPRELEMETASLHDLLRMELILFDLRDHIEEGDEVDYFMLQGVESTDAQYVQIIRPFGTWNKLVKRQDGQPIRPEAGLEDLSIGAKLVPRQKRATGRRRKPPR
jgi:Restriction endonuclease